MNSPTDTDDTELDGGFLSLPSSTLAALTSFYDEQAATLEAMASIATQFDHSGPSVLQLHSPTPTSQVSGHQHSELGGSGKFRLWLQSEAFSVDKFKEVFKENWGLSQFWYTQDTVERLTKAVTRMCPVNARVAFVCCPTAYVAFKKVTLGTQTVLLLEYDRRFSMFAGADFVYYDLNEPLSFSRVEALRHSQDIVVVDPPFHSEMSQRKIASTVAHLLHPRGQLVLLTGLTLSQMIYSIYPCPPLPKLRPSVLNIEHDGVGRLATPYGCWVGGWQDGPDEEEFDKTDWKLGLI